MALRRWVCCWLGLQRCCGEEAFCGGGGGDDDDDYDDDNDHDDLDDNGRESVVEFAYLHNHLAYITFSIIRCSNVLYI